MFKESHLKLFFLQHFTDFSTMLYMFFNLLNGYPYEKEGINIKCIINGNIKKQVRKIYGKYSFK